MRRKRVKSTKVTSIGWTSYHGYVTEDSIGALDVEYKSTGALYRFHDVPLNIYRAVMRARSIGRALARLVEGSYTYSRIT